MSRITWQNVSGGDTRGAAAAVSAAGETLNKGMDGLKGVVDDLKQQEIDSRTHAFKDYMASFNNPGELEAALQSGEVQEFSQRLGSLVDRDVVRDGADNRITSLYEQQDTDYLRGQTELAREALPIIDRAQQLQASGDFDGARQLLEANQNNGFLLGTAALNIQKGEQATNTYQAQLDEINQRVALGDITVNEAKIQAKQLKEERLVKEEYAKVSAETQDIRARNNAAARGIAKTMFSEDELGEDGLPKPEVFQKDPIKITAWRNLLNTYSDRENMWEGADPDLFMEREPSDTANFEKVLKNLSGSEKISNATAQKLLNTEGAALSSVGGLQGYDAKLANQQLQGWTNQVEEIKARNPLIGVDVTSAFNDEATLNKMIELALPQEDADKYGKGLKRGIGRLAAESMSNGEPIPASVVLAYLMQTQDNRNRLSRWVNWTSDSEKRFVTGVHDFMASEAGKKAVEEHYKVLELENNIRKANNSLHKRILTDAVDKE